MGWFRCRSLFVLYCYLQITRKESASVSLRLELTLVPFSPLYCAVPPKCWICPVNIVADSGGVKEPDPLLIWKIPHCSKANCQPSPIYLRIAIHTVTIDSK